MAEGNTTFVGETRATEVTTAAQVSEQSVCANCDVALVGDYCHECGEKRVDGRDHSLRHFVAEGVQEFTSVEHSKLYHTVSALLFKPGFLTREYFAGRRSRYLKPLNLCLGIFALSLFAFSFYRPVSMYDFERIVKLEKGGLFARKVDKWAAEKNMSRDALVESINDKWHQYMSVLQLASVFLFALLLALIYMFSKRYFVEHVVFSLHYLSFSVLTVVLLWPVYFIIGINPSPRNMLLSVFKFTLDIGYLFLAVRFFYHESKVRALLKSIVLFGGYFVFYVMTYAAAMIAAMLVAAKL